MAHLILAGAEGYKYSKPILSYHILLNKRTTLLTFERGNKKDKKTRLIHLSLLRMFLL